MKRVSTSNGTNSPKGTVFRTVILDEITLCISVWLYDLLIVSYCLTSFYLLLTFPLIIVQKHPFPLMHPWRLEAGWGLFVVMLLTYTDSEKLNFKEGLQNKGPAIVIYTYK